MEITIIHGQMHKGSTYHITEQITNKINTKEAVVHEFYLPKDMPYPCNGCFRCIKEGEQYCPHYEKICKILQSMEDSEVILIDSPTYCFSMTGQLKSLFDHFGFMWLTHRPRERMFHKTGIAISTAAGAGAKKVTRAIKEQFFWMGVSRCYQVPITVGASSWNEVSTKKKNKIEKSTNYIAKKVNKNKSSSLHLKLLFLLFRLAQKANEWNATDKNYWREKGWLEKERPWK